MGWITSARDDRAAISALEQGTRLCTPAGSPPAELRRLHHEQRSEKIIRRNKVFRKLTGGASKVEFWGELSVK